MTLDEAYKQIHHNLGFSPRSYELKRLETIILALLEQHGGDAAGPWVVVRTAGRGGGLISRHKSPIRAAEVVYSHQGRPCTCGCTAIVPEAQLESLPTAYETCRPSQPAK